jgi:hypothetical protein
VGKLIGAEEVLKTLKFCAGAELDFKHGVLLAISLPIPMKPPVCNGMIAPRDSWMMPPPFNEMIPPGAPRLLA